MSTEGCVLNHTGDIDWNPVYTKHVSYECCMAFEATPMDMQPQFEVRRQALTKTS